MTQHGDPFADSLSRKVGRYMRGHVLTGLEPQEREETLKRLPVESLLAMGVLYGLEISVHEPELGARMLAETPQSIRDTAADSVRDCADEVEF